MTLHNLYLFFIASLLLNLTPGNDMIYVASRSLSQGSRAGYFSALGIFAGCFVHILAAIFGLSIIISKSVVLFEIVKYAGAGYLIYIGIKMLLTKQVQDVSTTGLTIQSNWNLFKQGTLTNALNPKVAIFFISFLPQFVNPHSPYLKIQLFTLGLWFAIQGTVVLLGVAFLMSRTTNLLKQNPMFWLWQERITGIVLIGLGIKLALTTRK
jgi:threonine/homoserine/homoserine lactone efflux protein